MNKEEKTRLIKLRVDIRKNKRVQWLDQNQVNLWTFDWTHYCGVAVRMAIPVGLARRGTEGGTEFREIFLY